jgi:hypothetical protein
MSFKGNSDKEHVIVFVITIVYETLKDQTAKGAWPCSDKTTEKE